VSRFFDQAAMVEELQRQIALENQAAKTADVAAVSAYECEECGEPIPEARRGGGGGGGGGSGLARLPLLSDLSGRN